VPWPVAPRPRPAWPAAGSRSGITGRLRHGCLPAGPAILPAASPAANTLIAASSALGRALHQDRPRDLMKLLSMQLINFAIPSELGAQAIADAASARYADMPPGQADQAAAQAGKAGSPPASTAGARERATGHPAWPRGNAGRQYAPPIERRRSPGCFPGRQRPWLPAWWRRRRRSPYTRTRRKALQPAHSAAGPMTSGQSLALCAWLRPGPRASPLRRCSFLRYR
jgi:hypothetical protein